MPTAACGADPIERESYCHCTFGTEEYMNTVAHAQRVVREMLRVAARPGTVIVFDVQDPARRNDCLRHRLRTRHSSRQEHVQNGNDGLNPLYVDAPSLLSVGKESGCTTRIFKTKVRQRDYVNAACSYNVTYSCGRRER